MLFLNTSVPTMCSNIRSTAPPADTLDDQTRFSVTYGLLWILLTFFVSDSVELVLDGRSAVHGAGHGDLVGDDVVRHADVRVVRDVLVQELPLRKYLKLLKASY